ncbi:MAG: CCC motif membrane protein [Bacteroidota bacterium]
MENRQMLPNATAVLVLGICSIVFSCFFVGLVLGIVGLTLSAKGRKLYKENPLAYEGYGQLNAGWIMSIIGTVLAGLYLLYWLVIVAILGGAGFSFLHLLNNY